MRAHEFTDSRVMAKIERTGQIVQILRHENHVKFSNDTGWFLINTEPGRRTGTGVKWIPDSTRFAWVKNFESLKEAFDQPYPLTWEKSEADESVDALARLPDGSNLSIMFNQDLDDEGQGIYSVEFWRNNSQEVTGAGDSQRVFATVLAAIAEFIKKRKPEQLYFSANKDVEPGQKAGSRSNLYTSLVRRYATELGYEADVSDFAGSTSYKLYKLHEQKQPVTEGCLPAAIEEFLDSLNPDDCGVEDIGAYRIHFEGFTSDCKSSADYRRDPEAVYQQVYRDFVQREGGQKPVVQDMVGDERFPILYSIFRRKRPVTENKTATAKQVLAYINQTHHEPFRPGEKMHAAVMAHPQWQLQRVPLLNLNIPDQEYDDVDYDEYEPESDPYGRVMMVEPGHAGEVSQHLIDKKPIVIDADRYIIDGNHRAWAAKYLLNRDYIQAWVPVEQIAEITRRDFLRGAGVMAGTAALGSPQAQTDQDVTKIINSAAMLWAICKRHYPNNPNSIELHNTVKKLWKSRSANAIKFNEEYSAVKQRLADWEERDPAGYAKFVNRYIMNFAKIKADLESLPELMI